MSLRLTREGRYKGRTGPVERRRCDDLGRRSSEHPAPTQRLFAALECRLNALSLELFSTGSKHISVPLSMLAYVL